MLLLQLPQLLRTDSGAPCLEISVGHAPRVERPPLRQLPQLVDKAIHLRNEHAAPAVAHAIDELCRSASKALRPLDWPLARRDAPTRRSSATTPPSVVWHQCVLLLEPIGVERPFGRLILQLLRHLLDPPPQRLLRLL